MQIKLLDPETLRYLWLQCEKLAAEKPMTFDERRALAENLRNALGQAPQMSAVALEQSALLATYSRDELRDLIHWSVDHATHPALHDWLDSLDKWEEEVYPTYDPVPPILVNALVDLIDDWEEVQQADGGEVQTYVQISALPRKEPS